MSMEEIANKDTMFFLIFYFNNYYLIDILVVYQHLGNCPPTPPLTQH